MSTVKVTNLQNAGSASVNMTLDTAGNATVANTLAMGSSFLRNRIINGDMRIDQRNAGASVTPSSDATYQIDRWQSTFTAGSKYSIQQSTTAPSGFSNSMLLTSLSAFTPSSTDRIAIQQKIEGFNISDLGWGAVGAQPVTLSFWVRCSLTGVIGGSVQNSATDRSYPFSFTVNSANTWEQKTVTIEGETTGNWLGTTSTGIIIKFCLGAGATYRGTSGAWASANYWGPTGGINFVGTNGATLYITGVQLEAGTVATPFERRQYGQELALCQRYYYKIGPGPNGARVASGFNPGTSSGDFTLAFPVKMRTAPSALEQSGTAGDYTTLFQGTNAVSTSVPTYRQSSDTTGAFLFSAAAVFTTGQGCIAQLNTNGYLAWSAEL